ncbi:MAG: hypothetical protein HXX08_05800 [Chloroflexi bacterium]|uniref:Uncharacterized protein n=1 Tax=Candidatus Chlorohelix allophototropha TaxID=3003348 RepID=A0A8T7M2L5_9CHLR|nr:hypothetical protein [Chloroflexota bacterium]WJW67248.1 hypothetical protein OZ401_000507 [Chloroflexota bacterium L227-S17]
MSRYAGWVILILLVLFVPPILANSEETQTDPATSDYLPQPLQLLFPSLPASFSTEEVLPPNFDGSAPAFDLISMGTIPSPDAATGTPLTKTLTLQLNGGIKGRIFSNPPWLSPIPDRFVNLSGNGELKVAISVKRDAAQGAGILPGQTNWGRMRLVLNGAIFDYSVQLLVGTPAPVVSSSSERIFGLYRQIVAKLDAQGDMAAIVATPTFPNAGQTALGLIVDYLGENGYNRRMIEADFIGRVAETLSEKDYNGDGWVGFKPEDIVIGAPGWVLGRKLK